MKSELNIQWINWCWSWNSNTLATWCKELTHLQRPWCWERLKVGGEGDNRGWDGWMASPTQWTWVWVNSGSWWRTGRPGVLQSTGLQRVRHDWGSELNWMLVWGPRTYWPSLNCVLPSMCVGCHWWLFTVSQSLDSAVYSASLILLFCYICGESFPWGTGETCESFPFLYSRLVWSLFLWKLLSNWMRLSFTSSCSLCLY